MIAYNRLLKSGALLVFTGALTACGGGGGSDGALAAPYTPSVTVQGLAAAEVVSFTLNGDTINASANGVYSASATVLGNYSAALLTSPAGKTCAFNGVGNTYSGSSTSITLVCVISTTSGGGGGGGTTTPGAQPAIDIGTSSHQSFTWTFDFTDPEPLLSTLVSLTNFSNVGLTNASANNFVFYESNLEVQTGPYSEHKVHVQPITAGVIPVYGSIALDISGSLTSAQVATLKQEVRDFFAGTGQLQYYRLTAFDDQVTDIQNTYTNDPAILQPAVDSIPESADQRASSTNIFGATAEAALSANESVDYVVVITDGSHTADLGGPSSFDADTENQLIFVIAVGSNADIPLLQDIASPSNEEVERPGRVLQVADVSQVGEALQVIADYVSNMVEGLHVIHYLSPRRDEPNRQFTFEAKPLEDCSAESSLFPCKWNIQYDSTNFISNPGRLHAFPDALYPVPGESITMHIPDWGLCSSTPDFNWSLATITGSATLSPPSADGREATITIGGDADNIIVVNVVDNNAPGCAGSYVIETPSYTVP